MERGNHIIAERYLTPEEKINMENYIKKRHEIGKQPVTGEFVKQIHIAIGEKLLSDQQYQQIEEISHPIRFIPVIDRYNQYMKKRFDYLKIKTNTNRFIDPLQVHIVYPFQNVFPSQKKNILGYYSYCDGIYLKNLNRTKFHLSILEQHLWLSYNLIHEAFHRNGFQQYRKIDCDYAYPYEVGRSGYKKYLIHDHSSRFKKLNEMITECLTLEFFIDNQKQLFSLFSTSRDEFVEECKFIYDGRRKEKRVSAQILNYILTTTAIQLNKPSSHIWEKIKRGYFTGDMKHLQLIEQTFGRQSLKLLAVMPNDPQAEKDFLRYLKTQDSSLKEKLIKKYLHHTEHTLSAE